MPFTSSSNPYYNIEEMTEKERRTPEIPHCPWTDDKKCHLDKCGIFVKVSSTEGLCAFNVMGTLAYNQFVAMSKEETKSKKEVSNAENSEAH